MRRQVLAFLPVILMALLFFPLRGAAQTPGWTVLVHSPRTDGDVSGWGRWVRVSYDAYRGCTGASCPFYPYDPPPGDPYYGWQTPGYDDSGWSGMGYVAWDSIWWGCPQWCPISGVGRHVFRRGHNLPSGVTELHRRWFTVPDGYEPSALRLWVFSDNDSRWFINGSFVVQHVAGSTAYDISPSLAHSGNNLLAVLAEGGELGPVLEAHAETAQHEQRRLLRQQGQDNTQAMGYVVSATTLIVIFLLVGGPALWTVVVNLAGF